MAKKDGDKEEFKLSPEEFEKIFSRVEKVDPESLAGKTIDQLAEENATGAFAVLINAMHNPMAPLNFRITAAIRVLDQHLGKPAQAQTTGTKTPVAEMDLTKLSTEELEAWYKLIDKAQIK